MQKGIKFKLSLMMLIQFFIQGSWYVTMGNYLGRTLGFSGIEIGLAYGTAAIASIISPLFVGLIADRFFSPNRVLAFLNLAGGLLLFWLAQIQTFPLFFSVLLIYSICFMPTMALTSSISFDNLNDPGKEFSRIRLFGSLGWIGAGVLISFLSIEHLPDPFIIGGAASILGTITALMLPRKMVTKSATKTSFKELLGLDAIKLMKDKPFMILIIFSILICIPLAFYDAFTNLFLGYVNIDNSAAAMSLGQVAEVFFLFTFPFFFKKLKYKGCITAAIIAWVLMYSFFALGSYFNNNLFVYLVLPLHGFCFTFFFVSGQLYVNEKAPVSLRNSAQGLITFATYGVGKYVGTLVAGKAVDSYTIGAGEYNWVAIWTMPFVMALVGLIGFVVLFKEKKVAKSFSH